MTGPSISHDLRIHNTPQTIYDALLTIWDENGVPGDDPNRTRWITLKVDGVDLTFFAPSVPLSEVAS